MLTPDNVKYYGAKGDGVADDTLPIQTAIKAMNDSHGCLYFPPGNYRVTAPLNLALWTGVCMVGLESSPAGWNAQQNWVTVIKSSVSGAVAFDFSGSGPGSITGISFVCSSTATACLLFARLQGSNPFYGYGSEITFERVNFAANLATRVLFIAHSAEVLMFKDCRFGFSRVPLFVLTDDATANWGITSPFGYSFTTTNSLTNIHWVGGEMAACNTSYVVLDGRNTGGNADVSLRDVYLGMSVCAGTTAVIETRGTWSHIEAKSIRAETLNLNTVSIVYLNTSNIGNYDIDTTCSLQNYVFSGTGDVGVGRVLSAAGNVNIIGSITGLDWFTNSATPGIQATGNILKTRVIANSVVDPIAVSPGTQEIDYGHDNSVFALKLSASSGLLARYHSGVVMINGAVISVPSGTILLTDNTINGVVFMDNTGAVVQSSATSFSPNCVYPIALYTTSGGQITALVDFRTSLTPFAAIRMDSKRQITAGGVSALAAVTNGTGNAAWGTEVMSVLTSGANNAAFGTYALRNLTTGSSNTAGGYQALEGATTGNQNTCHGYQACRSGTAVNSRTCYGYQACTAATVSAATAFGTNALKSLTTGANTVAFGSNAGQACTTAAQSTFLGTNTDCTSGSEAYCIALGYSSKCTASNQLSIGGSIVGQGITLNSGVPQAGTNSGKQLPVLLNGVQEYIPLGNGAGSGTTPTLGSFGTGACTGGATAPTLAITGNSNKFYIVFTTGTGTCAANTVFSIDLGFTWPTKAICHLQDGLLNQGVSGFSVNRYIVTTSNSLVLTTFTTVSPANNNIFAQLTQYEWQVTCGGY